MEEIFISESRDSLQSRWALIEKSALRYNRQLELEAAERAAVDPLKWRPAKPLDIGKIDIQQIRVAEHTFGPLNFNMLLSVSLYCLTCENQDGGVEGFLCLNSFPNIPALLPEVWQYWARGHYGLDELSYENSYFIHFLIWDSKKNVDPIVNICFEIFLANPKLLNICCVVPPPTPDNETYRYMLARAFDHMWPTKYEYLQTSQSLFLYSRFDALPVFRLRKALPEDNDDIMGILTTTHPDFKDKLGYYYIATTLLKQEVHTRIIVANINVQTKGLMWLNSSVDVPKINRNFNIFPFQYLRKHGPGNSIVRRRYIDMIKKQTNGFFESLSLQSSESGSETTCLFDNIFEEEENTPFDETDDEKASEVSLYSKWTRVYLTQYQDTSSKQQIATIDWEEIDEKLQKYVKCYEYHQTVIEHAENTASAFALQLVAMSPDLDERLNYELLAAAFDAFPKKSYCILSLPTTKPNPDIVKYFTKVEPRPNCEMNESLYVIHKNVVCNRIIVGRVKGIDLEAIKKLLKYGTSMEIKPAKEMMHFIRHSLMCYEKLYDALVVKIEKTIIGIIILTVAQNIDLLRKYYRLDDYADYKILSRPEHHGRILYMYVNPIVEGFSSIIFKEIYRITGFHSIYYTFEEIEYKTPYNNLLFQMYPIRPRRVLPRDIKETFYADTPHNEIKELKPFSLFYHNVKLVHETRKVVDLKIVFIGFSRYTKAFLEYIIFQRSAQKFIFTNLTVLAQPGVLEADYCNLKINTHILYQVPKYNKDYQARLGFLTWISFVSDTIDAINRKDKNIILTRGLKLSYDILYLFENWQFGIPRAVPNTQMTYAYNFQTMNTYFDGHIFHYKMKVLRKSNIKDYSIILYGKAVSAFACVNYLVVSGFNPKNIHLFISISDDSELSDNAQFGDKYIKSRTIEELKKLKVNVYFGCHFQKWIMDDYNTIKKVCFTTQFQAIWLDCTYFVSYARKAISRTLFQALIRAGIVIVGSIVINSEYQTNDPNIYSCGSITKYKKGLYTNKRQHFYNHHEVARDLAKKTIRNVEAFIKKEPVEISSKLSFTIPHFEAPILKSYYLPGGLYFTCMKQPGLRFPRKLSNLCGFNDNDLITSKRSLTEDEVYCRIRLDSKGFVRDIYCLTKGYQNLEHLNRLYGLHESLLDNMKVRYEAGEITNLLEFLKGQWIVTITHDRFKTILNDTISIIRSVLKVAPGIDKITKKIFEYGSNNLSKDEKDQIKSIVKKCRHSIEKILFEYMSKDAEKYSVYVTPKMIEEELLKYYKEGRSYTSFDDFDDPKESFS